jgi:hypothetical protein
MPALDVDEGGYRGELVKHYPSIITQVSRMTLIPIRVSKGAASLDILPAAEKQGHLPSLRLTPNPAEGSVGSLI